MDCSGAGRQTLWCQGSTSAAGNHAARPSQTQHTLYTSREPLEEKKEREPLCFSVDLLWFLVLTVTYNQYWAEIRPFARPLCVPSRRFKRSRTRSGRHLSFNLGWGGGLAVHSWPRCFPNWLSCLLVSAAFHELNKLLQPRSSSSPTRIFFGVTVAFSPPHKYLKPSSLLA